MKKDIGRNEPCPCGSGKKYKKCCYKKHADKKINARHLNTTGKGIGALFSKSMNSMTRMSDKKISVITKGELKK